MRTALCKTRTGRLIMDDHYGGRELSRNAPNASGRKPSRKTEMVQARILDAAAKVFSVKGYQLTKLSDIAATIDVHVTALRYHFATKDVLVEEMMNSLVLYVSAQLREAVAQLPHDASPRAKIEAAARAFTRSTLGKPEYMSAHANVFNQVPADMRERHLVHLRKSNAFWRALVEEAATAGDLRSDLNLSLATQILMGTLIWTREWYKPGMSTPETIAEQILAILFDGLAPPDQRAAACGRK
ncbi:TetR/AcrR family transcriptional regulator [Corticibacterium sp. UT-5YL-CI-8]|nr:TetR/AcrR family transcriptional regulator [Tianweitania sp. UT-5YL-CI-8]